ncbi:hypothetical protein D9611_006744 [Ephemerocybe angulata]|uniref:Ricin B lectin domain-containing protein n=1 Tax=Ephemerocybe angulata TaxID=980116 RepID=A0A8H5FH15_9AGAR|nr:hypothetical protein D9611_006744 [Tulosesus angulatus]
MRTPFTLLMLATAVLATSTAQALEKRQTPYASQFVIHNSCPSAINLYIGGQLDSRIPTGGSVTKFSAPGFFYTDANGGNANGAGTLRAGFYDNGYYYMVRDGEGSLNTGMVITPNQRPSPQGLCQSISCNTDNCTTAFSQPPTAFPAVNGSVAPPPPYYRCPIENTTYDISFCSSGSWPGPLSWRIHPTFDHIEKCIDVQGGVFANGTPVQLYDCNGTPAQNWLLNHGSTKIQRSGTNFCLDAGSNPGNGVGMKIWTCYDGNPAQQWYYTDDNRIALEGKGQCLDLPNGDLSNSNRVQTWQCTNKNENQVWML